MKQTGKMISILLCICCLLSSAAFTGAAQNDIHNVIFMIGDGMGYNHLKLAEEQGYEIFMDDAPDLQGWSRTRSANNRVTDSAAGATALACGVRTNNHVLGLYPFGLKRIYAQPRSLTENAIYHGMKTGIVTSDSTAGATPAGFSVHTSDRGNTEDIIAQQLSSRIDLIWGYNDQKATKDAVETAGFTHIAYQDELLALEPGSRSYGQFAHNVWKLDRSANTPSLAEMTEKAISLLDTNNDNGFFLMVEGAHIDKNSHASRDGQNDYPEKVENVSIAAKGFDDAVRAAVDFAREDGHTIVLITADHETGDLRFDESTGRLTFHSASHTGANVPIFVYGANDLFENGATINNCSIANRLAEKLGWNERFPIKDALGTVAEPSEEPTADQPCFSIIEKVKDFFHTLIAWIKDVFKRLFNDTKINEQLTAPWSLIAASSSSIPNK